MTFGANRPSNSLCLSSSLFTMKRKENAESVTWDPDFPHMVCTAHIAQINSTTLESLLCDEYAQETFIMQFPESYLGLRF